MAEELDDLYASKHSVVQELFIKTADENYVTARFCFAYGLDVVFSGMPFMRWRNIQKRLCCSMDALVEGE